jgi:hypothetical protein
LLLELFDAACLIPGMASLGPDNDVVVVLHVGGSKASNIKHVLRREPRTAKTWFPAGSILPNEALDRR